MGAKICTPSPQKLDNEVHPNQQASFDDDQQPQNYHMMEYDQDDQYMEMGAAQLDLPDYQDELLLERFPLFEELGLSYHQVLRQHILRFASFDVQGGKQLLDTKRVLNESKILQKTLPCQESNAIFVAINEANMSEITAIIFGSEGTPYEHGAFLYSIVLEDTYPSGPPKVNLQTTGGCSVRFNPNLYQTGYVCLSLLGTWTGQPKENWQPNHSNISQVLLSIQTIVMNQDVFYNQPSYEDLDRKNYGPFNNAYKNIVKYGNIAHAMNSMIQSPPPQFKQIVLTHFYLKRNRILESVYGWIEEEKTADYGDLVFEHNYNFSIRYSKKPWLFKNDLISECKRLYNNLLSIDRAQTLLPAPQIPVPMTEPETESQTLRNES